MSKNPIKNRQAYYGGLPMTAKHTHFKVIEKEDDLSALFTPKKKQFSSNYLNDLITKEYNKQIEQFNQP